jgi:thiol-disulfide isomerase/thioredoxin
MLLASLKFYHARRKRLCALTLVLCVLSVCVACNSNYTPPPTASTNTPTGASAPRTTLPMPPVATTARSGASTQGFTLLDNRRMRLSDYLGHAVVLDFWATYCPPCRDEIPHLVELQRRYAPEGLHVIGLNVGGADDQKLMPEFVEKFKMQYTLGVPDPGMTDLYMSGTSIPQTLVFDRKGRLVKHFIGYDKTVSAELESAIKQALAAPAD